MVTKNKNWEFDPDKYWQMSRNKKLGDKANRLLESFEKLKISGYSHDPVRSDDPSLNLEGAAPGRIFKPKNPSDQYEMDETGQYLLFPMEKALRELGINPKLAQNTNKNESTGGNLGKPIKDNIMRNQPEFQQDVIQGLKEGRIPRTDAAGMLGISEEELDAFIEKLRKKEELKQSLKIS